MNKDDLKILQSDYDKTRVSRLPDRPNVGRAMGGQGLSAQELKARLDASSSLIVERFNALIEALSGVDEDGERCEGVADLMMTGLGDGYSLADLFAGLSSGEAAQRIKAGIGEYTLKGYLQYIKQITEELEKEQNTVKDTISKTIEKAVEEAEAAAEKAISDELGDAKSAAIMAQEAATEAKDAAKRAEDLLEEAAGQAKNDRSLFSNALKGTAMGAAVRVDDVSPLPHTMAVKVSGVEDVSAVKVTAWGKNFFENDTSKIAEVTYVGNSGVGTRNGYALRLPPGTYTGHATYKGTAGGAYIYGVVNTAAGESKGSFVMIQDKSFSKPTATIDEGDVIYIYNGRGDQSLEVARALFDSVNVQVEHGSTATDFEPYIAPTEYSVNADGTVDGVEAIHPTTTLMTDTEGAVLDVEYNRDINKAFEQLVNAIISQGGNV